jgi:hypothetical protein
MNLERDYWEKLKRMDGQLLHHTNGVGNEAGGVSGENEL